jgi:hypothetical protein
MGQIQRIQSVYLLLASIIGGSLFALPFATGPQQKEGIFVDGLLDVNDNMGLFTLAILVALLALSTIFLYNNRVLQMNLNKLNIVLSLALFGFAGYLFYSVSTVATIGVGLFSPLLFIVFVAMANKNIKGDEKLVRDSNRLR